MSVQLNKATTVTTKATKALTTAAATLQKVIGELATNVDVNETLLESISEAQERLNGLGEETAIKVRKEAVELELKVSEDKDRVLSQLLSEKGLITISPSTLSLLEDEITDLKLDASATIESAVTEALMKQAATHKLEVSELTASHNVETATLKADSKAKDTEITFQANNIKTLQDTITAERDARVTTAQAESAKQGVVVKTN